MRFAGRPDRPQPRELLTAPEVAAILGITPRTVRRHAAAGELPKIKIGRSVRFDPADVVAFIRNGAQEGSK